MDRQWEQKLTILRTQGAKKACYSNPWRSQSYGGGATMGATASAQEAVLKRRVNRQNHLTSPFSYFLAQPKSLSAGVPGAGPAGAKPGRQVRPARMGGSQGISTPSPQGMWQEEEFIQQQDTVHLPALHVGTLQCPSRCIK